MALQLALDIGTPLTIVVATIIGALQLRQNRKLARQSHTLDVLLARFTGGEVSARLLKIARLENVKKKFPEGSKQEFEVRETLNLYEFIAAAAKQDILDTTLIYEVRGGAMMRTFDAFRPYIKARRDASSNPKLWEHYEWFVEHEIKPRRTEG